MSTEMTTKINNDIINCHSHLLLTATKEQQQTGCCGRLF